MQPLPHDLTPHLYASPILIVDDNAVNRLFLEGVFRAHGFSQLVSVASGEEALAQLAQCTPDMVILDILMPGGMDGFACCAAIRQQPGYAEVPVLIQTAITEPQLRVKAFASGATDFVSKPIHAEELCARVRVHLQMRHALTALQGYKQRIEIELESARQLQLAILPSVGEVTQIGQRCNLDIASHFEPCSEIGGDVWGAKNIFPHQTALWLVDFSGHGVASALNAFRLHAYLQEASPLMARPGEYLAELNDKLLSLLLRGQFATMFYGIVDAQSQRLFYACACAPHPIILRRATGKAALLDGSGSPLGIGLQLYATQTTPFAMGDLLFVYSDALTETPNAAGEYIREEALMALLEQHRDAAAADMVQAVVDYFYWHMGSAMLCDDLTMLVCRRAAPAAVQGGNA